MHFSWICILTCQLIHTAHTGSQICIYFFFTQGDTTLLCPSSSKEEDVLELCIGVGQEHPEGVLMLCDTESILGLGVNLIWWVQYAITMWPQSGRANPSYSASWPQRVGREGSTWLQGTVTCWASEYMSRVGVSAQPLPSASSLEEGLLEAQMSTSQMELTRDVWDLNDDQLWEVLQAL